MNVMEHVEDPALAVDRLTAMLVPGASYRFLCPNYLFPYEPHFNMPTFGSKALTERLMRRRIEGTHHGRPCGCVAVAQLDHGAAGAAHGGGESIDGDQFSAGHPGVDAGARWKRC